MWCICPDPKCRIHWSCHKIGGWSVVAQDLSWGEIPMMFHPDNENEARWVASNHGVDCVWFEPSSEPVSQ